MTRAATPGAPPRGDGAARSRRARRRLRFFGGKGGVGKTTVAAATALARGERRPTHARGVHRSRPLAGRRARPPAGRRGSRASPAGGTAVDAVELDADRALARWLRGRRGAASAHRGARHVPRRRGRRPLPRSALPGGGRADRAPRADARRGRPAATTTSSSTPRPPGTRSGSWPSRRRCDGWRPCSTRCYAKHRFLSRGFAASTARTPRTRLVAEIDAGSAPTGRAAPRSPRGADFRWVVLPRDAVRRRRRRRGRAAPAVRDHDRRGPREPRGRGDDDGQRVRPAARARAADAIRAVPSVPTTARCALVPELMPEPRGPAALRPLSERSGGARLAAPAPAGCRPGGRRPGHGRAPAAASSRADRLAAACSPRPSPTAARHRQGRRRQDDLRRHRGARARRRGAQAPHPAPVDRPGAFAGRRPRHARRRRARGGCRPDRTPRRAGDRRAAGVRRSARAGTGRRGRAVRRPARDSRFDVAFDRAVVRDLLELTPPGAGRAVRAPGRDGDPLSAAGRRASIRSGRGGHRADRPHPAPARPARRWRSRGCGRCSRYC